MTMVKLFRIAGQPFLIGDVLVTKATDGESSPHAAIPSGDAEVVFPLSWCRRISGSQQKLVIVAPNLAIGWAESPSEARAVVRALRQAAESKPLSFDTVRGALTSLENSAAVYCEILGWIVEEGVPRGFSWRSNVVDSFREVESAMIGSAVAHPEAVGPEPSGDTHDPWATAISHAAKLMGNEIAFGDALSFQYGGAFQVCGLRVGRFEFAPPTVLLTERTTLQAVGAGLTWNSQFNLRLLYLFSTNKLFVAAALLSDRVDVFVHRSLLGSEGHDASEEIDTLRERLRAGLCATSEYVAVWNVYSFDQGRDEHGIIGQEVTVFPRELIPGYFSDGRQADGKWVLGISDSYKVHRSARLQALLRTPGILETLQQFRA